MKKNNITIDDLAIMVQKGFNETAKKADMDLKFEQVSREFKEVGERFDKIEKLILADHKKRIEKLEDEIKEIKGSLALIFK
ncbi:MAG: hypothetical protein AAB361_02890 [Patescibacteria group bacterium]